MPRSGRPQPNPLTCMLSHAETAAFRKMAARRGSNVNRILAALARAELKTWQQDIEARPEISSAYDFLQAGLIPRKDTSLNRDRPRDVEAHTRHADPPEGLCHDTPTNIR